MVNREAALPAISATDDPGSDDAPLDRVFFALSDPVRRAILERLDTGMLQVSELAAPFAISLQAVSRHIHVLVRAGLVRQERTGRISRCSLEAGRVFAAAVWINRYSKYWQGQFDLLAATLADVDRRQPDSAAETPAFPTDADSRRRGS
jgi:DNA-binding transcriptional ArsR family regulator